MNRLFCIFYLLFVICAADSLKANTTKTDSLSPWSVKKITISSDHFDSTNINLRLLHCNNIFRVVNIWGENDVNASSICKDVTEFVDRAKKDGYKTTAMLGAIAMFPEKYTKQFIETASTKNPSGIPVFVNKEYYHGCLTNPYWQTQFQRLIEILIDTGIDAVEIDQPALENWHGECYCDYCMAAFRNYIKQKYSADEIKNRYKIENIDSFDYRTYLKKSGLAGLSEYDRVHRSYWGHMFLKFQFWQNWQNMKKIIESVKKYAAEKNRKLDIFANVWGLSAEYIPVLQYTDVADIAGDIRSITVWDPPLNKTGPPHVSWMPISLMAAGVNRFMNAPAKPIITFLDTRGYELAVNNFNCAELGKILIAESLATNSVPVLPYKNRVAHPQKAEFPFETLLRYSSVLAANRSLFEDGAQVLTKNAIYIPYSSLILERFSGDFIGTAYLLSDSHVPYSVVFNGDGEILPDSLTLDKISDYSALFIPNAYWVTENEKNVIYRYLENGGSIVISGGFGILDELGYKNTNNDSMELTRKILSHKNCFTYNDKPSEYAVNKTQTMLNSFKDFLKKSRISSSVETDAPSSVRIQPSVLSDGSVIVHIINTDYSQASRSVPIVPNISVFVYSPKKPAKLTLLNWDKNITMPIDFNYDKNMVKFSVKDTDIYATVKIEY